MTDFGAEAQKAAEAHLAACQEAFWDWEDGEREVQGEEQGSPASAPFCNCDTCIVREVLFAAWPILEKAAMEESEHYKKALEEIVAFGNAGSSRHRARLALADGVGAEQEDQPDPDGNERSHDVEP